MMSGTAHIIVGWSTLASPLLPFRTLVDISVIVLGEEYPTFKKRLKKIIDFPIQVRDYYYLF